MKLIVPLLILMIAAIGCMSGGDGRTGRTDSQRGSTAPPADRPTIDVTPIRLHGNRVSTLAEFEVKNTSNRTLEYLKMDASFYDKDDNFITGESGYHIAKWQGLPPGARSSGLVQTEYDPRIKKVSITFSAHGDEPFTTVDVVANEVQKLK